MNNLLLYLLKAHILFLILFGFYRLILHRSGLHRLNRIILLLLPLSAMLIPLLKFHFNLYGDYLIPFEAEEFSGIVRVPEMVHSDQVSHFSMNSRIIVLLIYIAGMVFRYSRALFHVRELFRLIKKSACHATGRMKYIYTPRNDAFSFFHWIFLPSKPVYGADIVRKHEEIHVRQGHSYDLLWQEIVTGLFWINPAIHMYRHSLHETHEYIADKMMLQEEISLSAYLTTLMVMAESRTIPGMVSSFRKNALKNRITMMYNRKRPRLAGIKYLLLIPLVSLLFYAFSDEIPGEDIPSIKPVEGATVTLAFGFRGLHPITKKPFTHKGIDLKAPLGTPVVATAEGVVVEAEEKEGWGKLIVIRHANDYVTYYAHLQEILVKNGDQVRKEQLIGKVGSTGYSTGPHLHYEVHLGDEAVDPADYFGEPQ